jgi:Uncharacterized protein conserved in bacteria
MKLEEKLLGRVSRLYVTRFTANGIYLGSYEQPDFSVLLPNNQVPEGVKKGDILSVFIYRDSEDRLIATMEKPYISLGEMARLRVTDVTNIGVFLDWGLAKDLFLPFKEQTHRVKKGEEVLAALYIDKSSRLCATMHIYEYLSTSGDFQKGDHVEGVVYQITDSFGAFVAVQDKYSALIPHNEMNQEIHVGDNLQARIKEVREDGKLTLSLQEKVKVQMGMDAEVILEKLEAAGGSLPFHDKTSPEIIKREFRMSKNAFKRAIGRLMKQNRIEILEDGIRLL